MVLQWYYSTKCGIVKIKVILDILGAKLKGLGLSVVPLWPYIQFLLCWI